MTRVTKTGVRLAACAVLFVPLALGAQEGDAEEDEAFDRTPRDCIVVSTIRETDALDDQNIIFRGRGNRVYRNHLPRRCPGLARENRIGYEARGGRLCNIDTITVLEQIGVGFRPGFTCRLGEFVPLSPEEVEDLDLREEGRQTQGAIESRPVDLDEDDEEEGAPEEAAPDASAQQPEDGAPR